MPRSEEALAGYDAVLRLAPDHVDALYNRGMSLYIMNRGVEAVECFEQTIALRPGYGKARIGRCIAQRKSLFRYFCACWFTDALWYFGQQVSCSILEFRL